MQVRVLLDQRAGEAVDDVARRDAVHAFTHSLFLQLTHIFLLEVLDILAVVELELLHRAHAGLLGLLQPGEDGEDAGDAQGVRRDMHVLQRALVEQLLVDLDLIGDAQVVRHLDQDDAVLQRLGLLVADERLYSCSFVWETTTSSA